MAVFRFDKTTFYYHGYMRTWLCRCRAKPQVYLGWLIGHEGKGSIAAYLKERFESFWLIYEQVFCNETCVLVKLI